jgi:broad specificity phosphatase PhoE
MELLLVKHSHPEIRRDAPPESWHLSKVGEARAIRVAEHIAALRKAIGRIVSSTEPKSVETAELIAKHVEPSLSVEVHKGLHEHVLDGEWFDDQESFDAAVSGFFQRPEELVLGKETAAEAVSRFEAALSQSTSNASESVIVVTHGRVLSLFAAHRFGRDVVEFWRSLGLPALVALGLPDLEPIDVVERFEFEFGFEN